MHRKIKVQIQSLWEYKDVAQIDSIHLHKYYKIKNYYKSVYDGKEYFISFEKDDKLIYQFFIACPIYDKSKAYDYSAEDTLMMFQNEDFSYRKVLGRPVNDTIYGYVGYVFEKVVDNNITDSQKKSAKDEFIKNAISECHEMSYKKKIEYFERVDSGYEYDTYIQAINPKTKMGTMIFIPQYESFK